MCSLEGVTVFYELPYVRREELVSLFYSSFGDVVFVGVEYESCESLVCCVYVSDVCRICQGVFYEFGKICPVSFLVVGIGASVLC